MPKCRCGCQCHHRQDSRGLTKEPFEGGRLISGILLSLPGSVARSVADSIPATQTSWISDCWNTARVQMRVEKLSEFILIIDEIQKIKNWSEVVKKEWDADTFNDINMKVVLLGSSRVLLEKGLSDSMMGRFEEIRMTHWSYPEMRDAFNMSLEQYLYFGGYPGAAFLIEDEERWGQYINGEIGRAHV